MTAEGAEIAPSLANFTSDRPFCVDMLLNDWLVEAALAQNTPAGARADPVIIRDGDRGRIIPAFQGSDDALPKGAVAADIIAWLYGYRPADPVKLGIVGQDGRRGGRAAEVHRPGAGPHRQPGRGAGGHDGEPDDGLGHRSLRHRPERRASMAR